MEQLEPGLVLQGRYRLVEPIGTGGFARTWKAHDELFDEPVAIKCYDDADAGTRERCLREARLLARQTGNSGVVNVRDLVDTGDRILLVMEYLDGCDLSQHLERCGTLDLAETIGLLSPIAQALSSMHAQRLVHRDVSPDNIRLTSEGAAKLVDFGSALDAARTGTPTIAVKPGYAPPEQYASASEQGPWTDTYSLAATVYHCLCGRAPMDALQRTFHDELPAPSAVAATIPPAVDQAIARGLALDHHERTQAPATLMEELRTALGQPAAIEASSPACETNPAPPVDKMGAIPSPVAKTGPATRTATEERRASLAAVETDPRSRPTTETAPGPGRASESKPRHPRARPPRRPSHRAKLISRRVGLVAGALLVVVAVALGIANLRGRAGGQAGSHETSVSLEQQRVTAQTVDALGPDTQIESVTLTGCIVDQDALARFAELPSLDAMTLTACDFDALDPLADSPSLRLIAIEQAQDLDGTKTFGRDFPSVEALAFHNVEFGSDDLGFLGHFPTLESLDISPVAGIGSIESLGLTPHLHSLNLSGIDLSDGRDAPLARCTELTDVIIDGCGIDDLAWAASCPNLHTLSAQGNRIASLEPLRSCPGLRVVLLSGNQIESLDPLSVALGIERLEVVDNKLGDLRGLEDHSEITELFADANALTDINALAESTKLVTCSLSHNQISDVSALARADQLMNLNLSHNLLANLDVCERLIKLKGLDASHNQIVDISKLASCTNLRLLALQDNQIQDIGALANGFTHLAHLDLSMNRIGSLAPLADCAELMGLVASANELSSLDGLGGKPKLEYLLADGNRITDIADLASSTGVLRALDLGNNQVSDLSALSDLFSQSEYDLGVTLLLDHNRIERADDLNDKPKYYLITLWGNPLASIDFLRHDGMRWDGMCIPHVEGTDYTGILESQHIPVPLTIVGAPFDQQARILEEINGGLFEPIFLTEEEADAMAAEKRAQLHNNSKAELTEPSGKGETDTADYDGTTKVGPAESTIDSETDLAGLDGGDDRDD